MARKPRPQYDPVPVPPEPLRAVQMPQEEVWADGALNVREAANFLGIGQSFVWELVRSGEVPTRIVKGRRVLAKKGLVVHLSQCPQ